MHLKAIDEWSPIHWVCGFVLAFTFIQLDMGLEYIILTIIVWEILEYLWLGKAIFGRLGLNGEESRVNVISDLFFGFIGAMFAYCVFML